jgi:hypothetical protein
MAYPSISERILKEMSDFRVRYQTIGTHSFYEEVVCNGVLAIKDLALQVAILHERISEGVVMKEPPRRKVA